MESNYQNTPQEAGLGLVDRPTQLICISDMYDMSTDKYHHHPDHVEQHNHDNQDPVEKWQIIVVFQWRSCTFANIRP